MLGENKQMGPKYSCFFCLIKLFILTSLHRPVCMVGILLNLSGGVCYRPPSLALGLHGPAGLKLDNFFFLHVYIYLLFF